MKIFARAPWYLGGLAFECQQCGRCCAGPDEGYVWVTEEDIEAIANHLRIPPAEMYRNYVRKVSGRYSLVERKDNRDCILLVRDALGQRRCGAYPVRPVQCRTWPFWTSNLGSPEAWASAGRRCAGINRGSLVPFDQIETRRLATRE